MKISFWSGFAIFGVVSKWAEKALADGRVTLTEALELVAELAKLLGVEFLFEIPAPGAEVSLITSDAALDMESASEEVANTEHTPPERGG